MSDPSVPTIYASKHNGAAYLTACAADDPDACHFEIRYYVHGCGFASGVAVDNHYLAKQIQSAMMNHYLSGRKAAMADLRQLIGAKDK